MSALATSISETPAAAISINPASGEDIGRYPYHSAKEVEQRLLVSAEDFNIWRTVSILERVDILNAMANILRQNQKRYSEMITREMGKTY